MAIEDEDIRDREIWTSVRRQWYSKVSDKAPTTGRLHHHLAILARPNAVQQLFYYTKSLCVETSFKSTRDAVLTLLDPILGHDSRLEEFDDAFAKTHVIFDTNDDTTDNSSFLAIQALSANLDDCIARMTRSRIDPRTLIAIAITDSLLEYRTMHTSLSQVYVNSLTKTLHWR